MSAPASPAVRHITTASVVVVASIAAAVSYSHMQQLADHAGEAWRSWLIPISIDGLVVAASMVLLTRRRAGVPGGALAWGALAAGVLASLAANMADARPEITAVLVAGWPAAAFAVGFELLLQQRWAETSEPPRTADVVVTRPLEPSVDRTDLAVPPEPARPVPPSSPGPPALSPAASPAATSVKRQPAPVVANLVDRVRPLVAEGLGRAAIASRLGITQHQARQAIDQVKAEQRPALRLAGER